jgi:hypothetical protein
MTMFLKLWWAIFIIAELKIWILVRHYNILKIRSVSHVPTLVGRHNKLGVDQMELLKFVLFSPQKAAEPPTFLSPPTVASPLETVLFL